MSLQYNYNKSGSERKALVDAVSRILEKPAVYLGAPTFAYAVGDYRISRKGSLFGMNDAGREEMERLVLRLQEEGFIAETPAEEDSLTEETIADTAEVATENVVDEATEAVADNTDTAPLTAMGNSDEENTLTIEIPKTGFTDISLDNLQKIIASKAALLKKALGTDNLAVIDTGDTLKFPWFTLHGLEGEADAYSRLVAAICDTARKRRRITAKERDSENDKFSFRLFLVQLGFVGNEYKTARRILLRHLTGNSSWKSGHRPERNEGAAIPPNPEEAALVTAQDLTLPLEEADAAGYGTQEENAGGETYGK